VAMIQMCCEVVDENIDTEGVYKVAPPPPLRPAGAPLRGRDPAGGGDAEAGPPKASNFIRNSRKEDSVCMFFSFEVSCILKSLSKTNTRRYFNHRRSMRRLWRSLCDGAGGLGPRAGEPAPRPDGAGRLDPRDVHEVSALLKSFLGRPRPGPRGGGGRRVFSPADLSPSNIHHLPASIPTPRSEPHFLKP